MKKQLFILLLTCLASITASAYDFCVDGIYYDINRSEAIVTYKDSSYNSYSGAVDIPPSVTYNGITYPVTSIGIFAFYGSLGLTSVTIPESITSIDGWAFFRCRGLNSVNIPNSVTQIGDLAFVECSGLTSLTIPDSVTSIGNSVFSGCVGLTSLTIPNSVISIENSAFSRCAGLTSVTIPESVTSIGARAFYGCTGLTSVTIPESVKFIDDAIFSGCSGMIEFNGKFASADHRCLIVNGVLNSFAPSGLTEYSILDSVTSIGFWAFHECKELLSVIIPNSVTQIGNEAFSGSGLITVTIPDSVIYIGEGTFYDCGDLEAFYSEYASSDNRCLIVDGTLLAFAPSGLTAYVIPDSVTSIGDRVFWGARCLTSVTIPESVISIGSGAFYDTAIYNDDSNWVDKVLYINKFLIKAKSDITGAYAIKEGTLAIAGLAFYDCNALTSVTIPDSVISIGSEAFKFCTCLTSVDFGNTVKLIDYAAFSGCNNLTVVTLPNSVTSIGYGAFYGCLGLTSVTIPDSVTSIGGIAFLSCRDLASVTVYNANPANIALGETVFCMVPTDSCILYVPYGSKDLYAAADQWKDFWNIEEFTAGVDDILLEDDSAAKAPYYDLMGRRITRLTPGLYIHKGKKVLVK